MCEVMEILTDVDFSEGTTANAAFDFVAHCENIPWAQIHFI